MKRLATKIMTIAACAAMMLSVPFVNTQSVQAAVKSQGTVNLATTTKKLTIPKGTSTVIKNNTLTMVKGRRYAVKFKINGKAYSLATLPASVGKAKVNNTATASIKSNLLTANKAGTTNLRVIKNGKDLVKLKVKVIDTTAHKHSWKNIAKATCATKGKKLCKTCGATGTTAMSKTHSFTVTKKATCERKGVETCTNCGLQNTLPKTDHVYKTVTANSVKGKGKAFSVYSSFCGGCNTDMTNWTKDQMMKHHSDFNHFDCFDQAIYGNAGETRYPEYVKEKITETYCKYCGAWDMDKTYNTVLYRCDKYGNKLPDGETAWSVYDYENYCDEHRMAKFLCADKHPAATAKKAAAKRLAVANPQDVITDVPNTNTIADNGDMIADTDVIVSDNTVLSENEAVSGNAVSKNSISENETVSDNSELNTNITDQETGGDSVFGDSDNDNIVIENTDNNDGIVIEDIDDADEEPDDDGNNDYDDSEGEVIEDE